jgi:hypothetical protein
VEGSVSIDSITSKHLHHRVLLNYPVYDFSLVMLSCKVESGLSFLISSFQNSECLVFIESRISFCVNESALYSVKVSLLDKAHESTVLSSINEVRVLKNKLIKEFPDLLLEVRLSTHGGSLGRVCFDDV